MAHLAAGETGPVATNAVDGHGVAVRHFGVVLPIEQRQDAANGLTSAGAEFIIAPTMLFAR